MTHNPASARPTWRAWTALLLLALTLFMMATDFTVIFLATPAIAADLTPSTTQMLWIVHIGELVAAGLFITMGWLTARLGPRSLLLISMALYGLSSALAAFAANAETLLAARVLIGIATAAAAPAGIAMLRSLFSSAQHFGIAFAVVMGAFPVGAALGPPMGGLFLEYFWWGSVFLVNVPVAAVVLLAGTWLFPRARERTTDRIDMVSVVISLAAVVLTIYGLQNTADRGISVLDTLAVGAGIVFGGWFVRRQRRVDNPLLDLRLFSVRVLRILLIVFVLGHVAFVTSDFVLIQYLEIVAGIPALKLGLILAIPATAAIVATALTPALTRKLTPATVLTMGTGVAILGTLTIMIALVTVPTTALLTVGLTIVAFGFSPPMVVGAQLMITSVPKKQSGPAAAVQNIAASIGVTVGIALLGSVMMAVFSRVLAAEAPGSISESILEQATETPGGAAAVAQSIGGQTGTDLLQAAQDALSWGAVAAYIAAFIVGVVTMLILRGLRGVELPDDEDAAPEPTDTSNTDTFNEDQSTAETRILSPSDPTVHSSTTGAGQNGNGRS